MLNKNFIIAVILILGLFAAHSAAQDVSPESTVVIFGNNAAPITINDNTTATPYPSTITVSGVNPAIITRFSVYLGGFTHTYPDDVDVILVGPQGQRAMLMSDVGGGDNVSGITLVLSQTAANPLPDETTLTAGTFRPTNYEASTDNFPAPGPGALTDAPADLSVFYLTNPNGVWKLYVVDDAGQDMGAFAEGWTLAFTVPQVFTVNSTADTTDGFCDAANCTLREAIMTAESGDLINFSSLFNTPQTINLLTALPDLNRSITIQGPGANLLTVRRDFNAADFRIFTIPSGVTNGVAISGITISNGRTPDFSGGVHSNSNLTLTNVNVTGNTAGSGGGVGIGFADAVFTNCTFSSNTSTNPAGNGGGIYFQGDGGHTLRVINSTISGNNSVNSSGGILNLGSGGNSRLEITNSTIAGNTTINGFGGGILSAGTNVVTTLRNTIVAGNTPTNLATGGGTVTYTSNGFNLSDNFNGMLTPASTDITTATPRLAPLSLNGGQTPTHALLAGSLALDRGNSSGSNFDQRGSARPIDLPGITNISDGADIGAFEAQTVPLAQTKSPFDYDGDGKTDLSIFRPAPAEWWYLKSSTGGNFAAHFGTSSDKIVPADYTGDGKTDFAFWRPSTGQWFILRSEDFSYFAFPFGTGGDIPVPADYDGDNRADAAIFRPSSLTWYIQKSSGGTDIVGFGAAGDKPVVADYDGDGKADIAIFRPNGATGSEWWIRRSSNTSVFATQFGTPTDKAVQGDYTGDGKADIAFWRPSNGNWFILRSEDFSFFAFPFGTNGDTPAPGDYDGDGKFDAAVFRSSNLNWYVQRSTAGTLIQQFGSPGDIPTPSAFIP